MCNWQGHSALSCIYWFSQAYTTSPPATVNYNYLSDASWYPDIATTTHITSDLSKWNLQAADYLDEDQLRVEDGSNVPISHSGSAIFSSPASTFFLNKILCVPSFQII